MSKLTTHNPATQEVLAELEISTPEQIDQMVKKSKLAQRNWAAMPIEQRVELILKGYEQIIAKQDEFAELINKEMGKTLKEAHGEVTAYSSKIKSLADEVIEALKPTVNNDGSVVTTTYRDPLGVCASITPWNFPLGMPHTLMMPSLMAGNTILFKPSEEVPLIGIKYAETLNQFLPEGVLQVVIGTGEQGKQLVNSDVQLITFTGSQQTGKHILESASKSLKRVILELGGKDPLIVLDDADVEAAAHFAAMNGFRNAGQVCVSTEKIFVMESQYESFLEKLISAAKDIEIGPMIHGRQKEHVLKQIDEALSKGAQIAYGDPKSKPGNFLEPTVLTGVTPDMNIMQDETFGPVACIAKVTSVDEAIDLANQGEFALGGAVFGKDTKNAAAVARRLNSGMVGINRGPGGAKGSPWVGAMQSGYGYHGSKEGHRLFTQLRIVSQPVE